MEQNHGKNLESYLSKFPTKYFEEDNDIMWKLIGSARKNIPLIEARNLDGAVIGDSDMAGKNVEPFYLVFGEDWFADGEVLAGEKNEIYPLRILGDPTFEGNYTVYKVDLMGGVVGGMPGEELQAGKRFSSEYNPAEKEGSRKVGDIRHASPISMRNEFSRVRLQHKVFGSMLNKKLMVPIPFRDSAGKDVSVSLWMHHVEYVVEETFLQQKNTLLMYGRSNRSINGEYLNIGKSGNILSMGAGIREQMEYGNVYYYNDFDLKLIEDILFELSTNALGMDERTFILETGQRGAKLFSDAVGRHAGTWMPFVSGMRLDNPALLQKTSSPLHSNAFTGGMQFVEWKFANNITVKISVNPVYDDTVRNKILHPLGGVAESYRFDIFDLGHSGQPNIQIAKVRGEEDYRGYQWGPFRDPFTGRRNNENAYTDADESVVHRYACLGAIVYDPNRCMSLIPAILSA
jgi:hypothetical protein